MRPGPRRAYARAPRAERAERLINRKVGRPIRGHSASIAETALMDQWQPISSAPFDQDLELSVIEANEAHALVFPCRRIVDGWLNVKMNSQVFVNPTHWRPWCH
jgi:hypothetical protein